MAEPRRGGRQRRTLVARSGGGRSSVGKTMAKSGQNDARTVESYYEQRQKKKKEEDGGTMATHTDPKTTPVLHIDHLRSVFQVLKENQLYVKMEKCSFAQPEVSFLWHRIVDGKIHLDESKVAIIEWEPPNNVSELRSFLGLINYYHKFVSRYSARATPLTDLLKKKGIWEWTEKCQRAFDDLKNAVTKEPVLKLPDYSKPFLVQTDASVRTSEIRPD
ncbi:unnamed protein product [Lactuca virosa]|uniref:Reverse transcriptase/retrotransposon-derived protein RNase H-like domain-containing protein n=1 Tax=Lactuca virosa TaxID=75947 RepID=A0AAU9MEQ5_9ASTR|nr:unnamed protein product [Lactuca virosa]